TVQPALSLGFSLPLRHLRVPPTLPIALRFPYTTLFRSVRHEREVRPRLLGGEQELRRGPVVVAGQPMHLFDADQPRPRGGARLRLEEHTSELQSRENLVCRLLLDEKKQPAHPPL